MLNPRAEPQKALSKVEVFELVAGGILEDYTGKLVEQHGIGFEPNDEFTRGLRDVGAGERLLKLLLAARPGSPAARELSNTKQEELLHHLLRGTGERGKKSYPEAEREFRAALQLDSESWALHFVLGNLLAQQSQWGAATPEYRAALRLNADYAVAHLALGMAFGNQGDNKEARADFQEATRLAPDNLSAHFNLGIALEQTGDVEGAMAEYRRALTLKPDFAPAHINLGGQAGPNLILSAEEEG